jgi:hypothetical protein
MCFSTNVSFGSGVVLSVVGIVAFKNVRTPSQLAFAAIPFLFALQQFSEGFVWLSLTQKAYQNWGNSAVNMFLIFAQVVWPLWVPLSVWVIETDVKRKKALFWLVGAGALLAGYHVYSLAFYPVSAAISSHHILYTLASPISRYLTGPLYIIVSLLPLFMSSHKKFSLLGFIGIGSILLTVAFYMTYLISVWCFFAALNSLLVVYLIREMNRPNRSITQSHIHPIPLIAQ